MRGQARVGPTPYSQPRVGSGGGWRELAAEGSALKPEHLQADFVLILRCDHLATLVVRIASASMSTIGLESTITRKSAVLFTALLAVAYSLPSIGLTSKYLPLSVDLIATTSPSLGWKRCETVSSRTKRAAKRSRTMHATAHARKMGVDRAILDGEKNTRLSKTCRGRGYKHDGS